MRKKTVQNNRAIPDVEVICAICSQRYQNQPDAQPGELRGIVFTVGAVYHFYTAQIVSESYTR